MNEFELIRDFYYKPENHKKEIDEAIAAFFDSQLMKIDPFSMSDDEIMQFIRRKEWANITQIDKPYRFCTVAKIKEISKQEYKNNNYEAIIFDTPKIQHNMSDFKYAMYPIIDTREVCDNKCLDFGLACRIIGKDGNEIDPYEVIGKELLLAYSIDVCNAFGKPKNCDRFFVLDDLTPDDIRVLIMQAQHVVLSYLYFFPNVYSTNAKVMDSYGRCQQSIETFTKRIHDIHFDAITDAYNRHCKAMERHGIKFNMHRIFPGDGIKVINISRRL